jgi:trafficking protein particle complex subunit 10
MLHEWGIALSWGGTMINEATNPTGSEDEDMEFSYEIHANPEVWLIGGKRRGNFQARENEVSTFPIMLLPQRHGHLLPPGLDIKAFELQTSASGFQGESPTPPPRKQVQSELDCRNHGESILVLPDLKSTTVSLDPGGPGGGPWLVESERRIELVNA